MAKSKQVFAANDRIDHHVYGLGTIVELDERHTTIAFDEAGTRKFVTSMVKMKPSDSPAPAKTVRKKKTTKTKAKTTKAKTTKTKAKTTKAKASE